MRILFACEFYHPSVGGVQEVVRQLAERLVERGHEVAVATTYLPERRNLIENGVTIVEFNVAGNAVRGIAGDVDAYRELVLAGKYDLFVVKAAQQWTFDALLPVLSDLPRPKIFIPCGFSALYDPAYSDYYAAMPAVLAGFDHLIFYAEDYRDIRMARGHDLANFSVVPNGASEVEFNVKRDPAARRLLAIDDDSFIVLTVGTFTGGMKGHRELAEAFALANLPGPSNILVLNGNVFPETTQSLQPRRIRALARAIRRTARRMLSPGRARTHESGNASTTVESLVANINRAAPGKRAMIVNLPRADLVQIYLNSDLFVFASNLEYSPLVLYEAAAAGLPFLTVPVGNAAEIAEWTGGGVVCPAPEDRLGYTRVDPAVLAEHMSRLANDPPQLQALGEAGRQAWSERFTWERITDKYEAIFLTVARQVPT